ncbi:hypothetical protein LCGC14_1384990 [marine sediment metagenome]|uniref:Uncharacterized protein n=1 Tax=marine sediment metagenome TaxID=412755 RepID=A0A0F9K1M2_9ZZZZ
MNNDKYAYSLDSETYVGSYDSVDEARIEASCFDDCKAIWVGTIVKPDPAESISVDWIIEQIDEEIEDEFEWLNYTGAVIDVTDRALCESKIKKTISEHITTKVFSVENVNEYQNVLK